MDKISLFTFRDKEVNMLYKKGSLAYSFEHDGKSYGLSVKPQSKSVIDIASATFQLLQNCVETIDRLDKQNNEN